MVLAPQFIETVSTATQEQQLVLVGLPHLSLDPQQSRGDTATFTERWGEFLAGAGPPPAPSPAQHSSFGRTAGQPAVMQHTAAHPAHTGMVLGCEGVRIELTDSLAYMHAVSAAASSQPPSLTLLTPLVLQEDRPTVTCHLKQSQHTAAV